jgi:endonuclease YncB( thermonuclease family)
MGLPLLRWVTRRPPGGRHRRSRRERQARREALGRAAFVSLIGAVGFLLGVLWNSPVWGQALAADSEAARFVPCTAQARVTCVVDGDTFWYRGAKIRVADIDTPEVSQPACPREAELGRAATARLTVLLNGGPFTLAPWRPDRDRYGRLLRTVTRGGESLGMALVSEGLAEPWQGRRGSWCG